MKLLHEAFYKDRTIWTQKRIRIHCDLWTEFLVYDFIMLHCTEYNEIAIIFLICINTSPIKHDTGSIHNFLRKPLQKNTDTLGTTARNCLR